MTKNDCKTGRTPVEEVQRTHKREESCFTPFYIVSAHFGAVLSRNFIDFSLKYEKFPLKALFLPNERFEDEKEGEIAIKRLKTVEKHHK